MPTFTKRSPKIRFEFLAARKQSTPGGLPALCRALSVGD
jgi:hypothetical protein